MVKNVIIYIGFLVLQFFTVKLLGSWDYFTNIIYPSFYRFFSPKLLAITGWIPFSIGDILYILIGILMLILLIKSIRYGIKGRKRLAWKNVKIIFVNLNIIYFVFHLFWGMNYYRRSLIERLPIQDVSTEELKNISEELLILCQSEREKVPENEDGEFTYSSKQFKYDSPKKIQSEFHFPYQKLSPKSIKKKSLYSPVMRYLGVTGYYNPFTGEAQYIGGMPSVSLPFTLAHEQAHQAGYAPEYEANFMGYLSCVQSEKTALKYSAYYKALKYVLYAVYPEDSAFVHRQIKQFSDGMQRDRLAEKRFHEKYDSQYGDAFSVMNDAYLKSNSQVDGIKSYNRFVELLVGWRRLQSHQ